MTNSADVQAVTNGDASTGSRMRRPLPLSRIAAILALAFGMAVVIVAVADETGDGPRRGFQRGGRALPAVTTEVASWL